MEGFKLITNAGIEIRFRYYTEEAPRSCDAFNSALPLTRVMYHARVSGQEIWFDNLPELDIIQENASVFTVPGEVVLGPSRPKRTKTAGCFGIYYGEGKGLDACNIFACVADEDREKLTSLGENIWKNGAIEVRFESLDQ